MATPDEGNVSISSIIGNESQSSVNACFPQAEYFNYAEKKFILVTDVILSSAIFVMGTVLNSLSILVLKRDVKRSSMSILLLALSTFDTVFIGLSAPYIVVYMGLGVLIRDDSGMLLQTRFNASPAVQRALPVVWYLGTAARTARNWIILIVALDRYIVVKNPFLSASRSNPYRARLYCVSVSVGALVYSLPLLLEYTVVPHPCLPFNISQAQPERLGWLYMLVYKKLMYIAFLSVGPVLWLLIFNVLLIRSLLLASKIRATITREATRRSEDTKMLVVIIALFVATELPGAVWHLLLDTKLNKHNWFYSYFYSLGSLLTLLNSAVNFFIYCVWSQNFRRNMAYALGRRKLPVRAIRFDADEYSGGHSRRGLLAKRQHFNLVLLGSGTQQLQADEPTHDDKSESPTEPAIVVTTRAETNAGIVTNTDAIVSAAASPK